MLCLLVAWHVSAIGEPEPPLAFPHGVASGDVTSSSAVLWTRTHQAATLKLEVSTDPHLQEPDVFRRTLRTAAAQDFTARVVAGPLAPDTTYYYRWRHGHHTSAIGTFRTAPASEAAADVRFAFSGDSDGTSAPDGQPAFGHFEVLDAVRQEGVDFFVYHGDTIYPDSEFRPSGPAETLAEYRDVYQINREIPALPNLLQATSIYAIWDDHEVRNNYAGSTVDPGFYRTGRQAFLEYMPIDARNFPADASCAGAPLFRVFSWGRAVDIIVLDVRSCRSASVEAACDGDPLPTLPPPLRTAFGLSSTPPEGCLPALFDPGRTMLGPVQKARFKVALRNSTATFKFVINGVPIQQFWGQPYDRWEGYAAERLELLQFIRAHNLRNVIFLTTDTHANLINEVSIDQFFDSEPIGYEFVTGPIARRTLQEDILAAQGQPGLEGFNGLLNLAGVKCRHLDALSYGVVEVDATAETATITLKDATGTVVRDQLHQAVSCQRTLGP
jgi:alkaline phosphatase D